MATTLWPHQQKGFDFAENREASLLGMRMGEGKSATAIALTDRWNTQRCLVVAPAGIRGVWRRELAKHSNRDHEAVILDKGSVRKRTAQADEAWNTATKPLYLVTNYESIWRWPQAQWLLSRRWDCVILDEAHRISGQSKVSEFCAELRPKATRRLALTGTPLTQSPLSIWGIARFLDPTVFGDDFAEFRWLYENRYTVPLRKAIAKHNQQCLLQGVPLFVPPDEMMHGVCNPKAFLKRLAKITYRSENVVLNLPPLTIEQRSFRLSNGARRLYDSIATGYGYEISTGHWLDVQDSYSITMRLQQITSGYLPDLGGRPEQIDTGKAECLADVLDEAGGMPVVVFVRFKHDLDTVRSAAERLDLTYGEISGRRKDGIDENAVMTKGLNVVGVQEQSGGAGIDLSDARIGVDYSPTWELKNYVQKIARLHRPPQKNPVIIYSLVAEDTIDEEIHRALIARQEVIDHAWRWMPRTSPDAPATCAYS